MSTREEIEAAVRRKSDDYKRFKEAAIIEGCTDREIDGMTCHMREVDDELLAGAYLADRQQRERDQQLPTREMFERLGATLDRFHVLTLKAIEWHAECHCPWWDAIQLDTIAKLRAACLLLGIETEWML